MNLKRIQLDYYRLQTQNKKKNKTKKKQQQTNKQTNNEIKQINVIYNELHLSALHKIITRPF